MTQPLVEASAATVLSAAGALPKDALTASAGALNTNALDAERPDGFNRLAELAQQDIDTLKKIKSLSAADTATLEAAKGIGRALLDNWLRGATQAVQAFRSKVVSNQSSVLPALAGNLLWAATAIEGVPAKVALSFIGATLGTLGTIPPTYDAIVGPVTTSYEDRLTAVHNDLQKRMDVLCFRALGASGLAAFARLEGDQRKFDELWKRLFRVPSGGDEASSTLATRAYILANLQRADDDTVATLETLHKAWLASVEFRFVGLLEMPPNGLLEFDEKAWYQHTDIDIRLFAERRPDVLLAAQASDPLLDDLARDRRAAVLLRIAVEKRWPAPTGS